MSKEKVVSVEFDSTPDIRIRVINNSDVDSIKQQKQKFPFELHNTIKVTIETSFRKFSFDVYNGYIWNGADIPRFLWRLVGSRTDNAFLVGSMIHDYLLEFKFYMLDNVLLNQMSIEEYRRLTSLIFRHIIKEQGTSTVKANVMSWCVDFFQMFNIKGWKRSE